MWMRKWVTEGDPGGTVCLEITCDIPEGLSGHTNIPPAIPRHPLPSLLETLEPLCLFPSPCRKAGRRGTGGHRTSKDSAQVSQGAATLPT